MTINVVNLSDVKVGGMNVSVPVVLRMSHFDKYVDKDGNGSGSNYPRDFVCPSKGLRSCKVHVQLAGLMIRVGLGCILQMQQGWGQPEWYLHAQNGWVWGLGCWAQHLWTQDG